jgi:hypothetical protein
MEGISLNQEKNHVNYFLTKKKIHKFPVSEAKLINDTFLSWRLLIEEGKEAEKGRHLEVSKM